MNTRRDHERPVSNPLPPQMAAFEEQKKLARSNPLTTIEQTPNFGTEQVSHLLIQLTFIIQLKISCLTSKS